MENKISKIPGNFHFEDLGMGCVSPSLYLTDNIPNITFNEEESRFSVISDINERQTDNHMWTITNERPFQCIYCDKTFKENKVLKKHLLRHSEEKPFQCTKCDKSFRLKYELQRHQMVHSIEKSYQCKKCNNKFKSNSELRRHMATHPPTEEKPYHCIKCGKNFESEYNLKMHVSNIHKEYFQCARCNKTFPSKSQLLSHMRTLISGKICSSEVPHNQLVKSDELHKKGIQIGTESYKCTHSDKVLFNKSNLRSHIKIHGDKQFPCKECGKTFINESRLKRHMLSHNSTKPYQCLICEKSFVENHNLKNHMRVHTGERPYLCTQCNQAFASIGSLKRHIKVHNGVKDYHCIKCNRAFSQKSHLLRHMERVHRGEILQEPLKYVKHNLTNDSQKSELNTSKENYQTDFSFSKMTSKIIREDNNNEFILSENNFSGINCLENPIEVQNYDVQHDHWESEERVVKDNLIISDENILTVNNSYMIQQKKLENTDKYENLSPIITQKNNDYTCIQCNKKFPSNSSLEKHVRMHTGEKPFKCILCGKKFSRKSNLKRHIEATLEPDHSSVINAVNVSHVIPILDPI